MEQKDAYKVIRESLRCGPFEYQKDPITKRPYLSAGNDGFGNDASHQRNVATAFSTLGFDVIYIEDRASVKVIDVVQMIAEKSQSIHSPIEQEPIQLSDLTDPQARKNFNAYAEQIVITPNGPNVDIHAIGAALYVVGIPHVLSPEKQSIIATNGDSIIKIKQMTHNMDPRLHQTQSL